MDEKVTLPRITLGTQYTGPTIVANEEEVTSQNDEPDALQLFMDGNHPERNQSINQLPINHQLEESPNVVPINAVNNEHEQLSDILKVGSLNDLDPNASQQQPPVEMQQTVIKTEKPYIDNSMVVATTTTTISLDDPSSLRLTPSGNFVSHTPMENISMPMAASSVAQQQQPSQHTTTVDSNVLNGNNNSETDKFFKSSASSQPQSSTTLVGHVTHASTPSTKVLHDHDSVHCKIISTDNILMNDKPDLKGRETTSVTKQENIEEIYMGGGGDPSLTALENNSTTNIHPQSSSSSAAGPSRANITIDLCKTGGGTVKQQPQLKHTESLEDYFDSGIIELNFDQNSDVIDVTEQIKSQSQDGEDDKSDNNNMYVVQVLSEQVADPDTISLNQISHNDNTRSSTSIIIELDTGDISQYAAQTKKYNVLKKYRKRKPTGGGDHMEQTVKRRLSNSDITLQQVLTPGSCKYETSSRGSKKLIDPSGYSYNIKAVNSNINVTYWQCSIRPKKDPCRASLIEKADGAFVVGRHSHNHIVAPGAALASRVVAAVKSMAAYDVYKPAQAIVKDVLDQEASAASSGRELAIVDPTTVRGAIPPMRSLIRSANRYRKSLRPNEPNDIDFILDHKHLPQNFFRVDLRVDYGRHLIFATEEQLTALTHAESWFADLTPATCRAPFKQLFTLTAFVGQAQADGKLVDIKLVPLVYVLMSTSRNSIAYEAILGEIVTLLHGPTMVNKVAGVLDKDLWKAFNHVLPNVKVRVCSFYYMKSLWKKVSQLGIMDEPQQQPDAFAVIKRYLALPFLPAADIPETFRMLQTKSESTLMGSFARYMQRTWINNKTLSIESWSSFDEVVRLDSDVNDWRSRLVARRNEMRARMPFYLLVLTLFDENRNLAQSCLVDDTRLKMRPLRDFHLCDYWERYMAMGERRSPYDLLGECTRMLGDDIAHGLSSC